MGDDKNWQMFSFLFDYFPLKCILAFCRAVELQFRASAIGRLVPLFEES